MKEAYFTPASIKEQAARMLNPLTRFREHRKWLIQSDKSALLVLDMQNYFLEPSSHAYIPSAPAILLNINLLIDSYAKLGLPIIFTRHLNTPEDSRMMGNWWREVITADKASSQISTVLDTTRGIVIEKSQYDAFYETNLSEILAELAVQQVVVCGVMTHLCCETTARSAFMHGFEVFFSVDGTATYNLEFHQASLLNLAHGFAIPVLGEEVLAAIGRMNEG